MAILHPLNFARGLCRLPRLALSASILLLASLASPAASAADAFPNRSIRMIAPFSAGGPADIVSRLYAQHLSDLMGQPVVVLNRDGAGGIIGTNEAARAAPTAIPSYSARPAPWSSTRSSPRSCRTTSSATFRWSA